MCIRDRVVDPVLVASTGRRLTDDGAVQAYRELLLPAAAVATPNLLEASVLLGEKLETLDDAQMCIRDRAIVTPAVLDAVMEVCARWEVRATVILSLIHI